MSYVFILNYVCRGLSVYCNCPGIAPKESFRNCEVTESYCAGRACNVKANLNMCFLNLNAEIVELLNIPTKWIFPS